MDKKHSSILCFCLIVSLLLHFLPVKAIALEPDYITVRTPISVELTAATDIQMEILLDLSIVENAKLVSPAASIADAAYTEAVEGDLYKLSIIPSAPISGNEVLFSLELTLKQSPNGADELCKLVSLTVNGSAVWSADNHVLLRGVVDNGCYNTDITPVFNQGTALLNEQPFTSGTAVSQEGSYTLIITDKNGHARCISFSIDTTAPVITVAPYDTNPTDQDVTVTAVTNEGTLNVESHTFTENGSFTFVATDSAGNKTEKTVTISHISKSYTISLVQVPDDLFVLEGTTPDISDWGLKLTYDNGYEKTIPVTSSMLTLPTSEDEHQAVITYDGQQVRFACQFIPKASAMLEITAMPTQTVYELNAEFNPEGLEVQLSCGEDFRRVVTDVALTGFDSATPGFQTIVVTYGELIATFVITVRTPVPESITSSVFTISDGYLSGAVLGNTVDILLAGLDGREHLKIMNGENEAFFDDPLSTGMTIQLMDGETVKQTLTVVVSGDLNGDGRISITDMLTVKSQLLNISELNGAQALAADYNADGRITITDFVQLKAYILGKSIEETT